MTKHLYREQLQWYICKYCHGHIAADHSNNSILHEEPVCPEFQKIIDQSKPDKVAVRVIPKNSN